MADRKIVLPRAAAERLAREEAADRQAATDARHVKPKNPFGIEVTNRDDREVVSRCLHEIHDLFCRGGIVLPDSVNMVDELRRRAVARLKEDLLGNGEFEIKC